MLAVLYIIGFFLLIGFISGGIAKAFEQLNNKKEH